MGAARARHRIAIGKSDQGTAQVSSIHDARARKACPEAAWLPLGQRWAGPTGLVTLRCAPAGRRSDPACPHLLQLPEGAYEARAKAEDDEQQQEGLVDGGDVYHDVD